MDWIFNLIGLIMEYLDKYNAFVQKLSVKHIWAASFLDVLGKVLSLALAIGIPGFAGLMFILGLVAFVQSFPIIGGISLAVLVIWIAMLCSASNLQEKNWKKHKKTIDKTNEEKNHE